MKITGIDILVAGAGWRNFDASPTLRIERLPLVGRFVKLNPQRFPDAVEYGDVVRGLPVPDASCAAVYASHVLEHLTLADFRVALAHTYRMLAPRGLFRLVVPDLEAWRAKPVPPTDPMTQKLY